MVCFISMKQAMFLFPITFVPDRIYTFPANSFIISLIPNFLYFIKNIRNKIVIVNIKY